MILNPHYQRLITQSRWPKFMSWQHPTVEQNCKTVFYMDAVARPQHSNFPSFLTNLTVNVLRSREKFAVLPHPTSRSITAEFDAILKFRKDIQKNVDASLKWLKQQEDFVDSIMVYQLTWFMFATHSIHWRNLTTFFWSRYSQEADSWRDQPLFAYSMHHFNYSATVSFSRNFGVGRAGFNGHQYIASNEFL